MQDLSFSWNGLFSAWDVFIVFLIPFGGGIPAGVLLAKSRGLSVALMLFLYFASDVVLAVAFEPVMKLMVFAGRRSLFLGRVIDSFRKSMKKASSRFGVKPSVISLIGVSFGVDPMTGRAAALAAGHGFVAGWAIAIAGDMIFFVVVMTSTLYLNQVLGDGSWAMVMILMMMTVIPAMVRRLRARFIEKSGFLS